MAVQGWITVVGVVLVVCSCSRRALAAANDSNVSSANSTGDFSMNDRNHTNNETTTQNVTSAATTTALPPPIIGDASYCPGNLTVLLIPGYGWDNLRNKEMEQIFNVNYSLCQSPEDGRYLIPDNMSVSPLSPVREELRAVLFQHWNTFVSLTADNLNKEGDNLFSTPGLSGSFTPSYQRVKESLVKDKAITSRVELRYPFFTVGLSLRSKIGDEFKRDVQNVADMIESKEFHGACYFSELLITKYGTHYVDRVDLGASISEEDSLLRSVIDESSLELQTDIEATAIAFFMKGVGMSLYKPTTLILNSTQSDQYLKARLTKLNLSIGGIFPVDETSFRGWLKSISSNLAIIQQEGKPLYELMTAESFPDLEPSIRDAVRRKIQDAIKEYYELNYHKGCTHVDSPNFSYQALKDDGSCKLLRKPFVFGGVYQTCEMVRSDAGDLCVNTSVKNVINGQLKCEPGFQTVPLYASNKTTTKDGEVCEEQCTGLLVFRTCANVCTTKSSYSRATYKVYWCVAQANDTSEPSPGLQFGGVFNDIRPNPITNGKTCPTNFQPVELFGNVTVCVAENDPTKDSADSVVFGGFYTCSQGNPLAASSSEENPSLDSGIVEVHIDTEGASGGIAVNRGSPEMCPTGYATYKIPTTDECNIYYCINNIVSRKNFTPSSLISPPFCAFNPNNSVIVGVTLPPPGTQKLSKTGSDSSNSVLSSDAVAGIIMGIFLLAIIVGIGIMVYVKKKKEREAAMFHDDYKELID